MTISEDFTTEVEARQAVIDAIWLGKKAVEMTFRRDRTLLKFIFVEFSKDSASGEEQPPGGGEGGGDCGGEVVPEGTESGGTGGGDDPKPT